MQENNEAAVSGDNDDTVRFEDLTVDDDLPIIERVARYTRSQIALQRLVHVKMLAETAELSGPEVTQEVLIPIVQPLVQDPESVIRQHLAAQLLSLSIVCMLRPELLEEELQYCKVADIIAKPDLLLSSSSNDKAGSSSRRGRRQQQQRQRNFNDYYDETGYNIVTSTVINNLNTLVADPDLDVRRAAADSLSGLALQLQPEDVPAFCLPIPMRLALQKPPGGGAASQQATSSSGKPKKTEAEQLAEELRITAANLLAELGGAASENQSLGGSAAWVGHDILPVVMQLCEDGSFRVRRSAVQALPRILGACTVDQTAEQILPTFDNLSHDDVYRVRKSTGECLVDMSRSLMIAAAKHPAGSTERRALQELRRSRLIPIADRLIQDGHKMVRQGMMQFLGPFMASFYPYQDSALTDLLPVSTESDGSNHMGIVAQFFPHATSMVSRLNSAQTAVSTAPTPVYSSLEDFLSRPITEIQRLRAALPLFIQANRCSALSLQAVVKHRRLFPPDEADCAAIQDLLLDYFAALAIVSTGDENTDAEMRVYCAYSFPAVVLLLGPEHWEGSLKSCFFTLINPNYGNEDDTEENDPDNDRAVPEPPLPVKRCLASSLHTVAHILGPDIAQQDVLPVVQSFFLKDSDDSVRLNVIRNFPVLLELLPPDKRRQPLQLWSAVVRGEEFLGACQKRSATNPVVLNWRQRDYLARSMVDLFGLLDPVLVREHLWPILGSLLLDSVSIVREDAIWSVPLLLKSYCPDNVQRWTNISAEDVKRFSQAACEEVVNWLQEYILKSKSSNHQQSSSRVLPGGGGRDRQANFSERQLFCRICCAVGLAMRLSEEQAALEAASEASRKDDIGTGPRQDPVSVLTVKFKSFVCDEAGADKKKSQHSVAASPAGPYKKLSSSEKKHLKRLLLSDLLPRALEMKEDRISNVRVTLMKVLQLMPADVRASAQVQPVLQALTEEVETWESFGNDALEEQQQQQQQQQHQAQQQQQHHHHHQHSPKSRGHNDEAAEAQQQQQRSSGPVDVDAVPITPQASQEEDEAGDGAAQSLQDHASADEDQDDEDISSRPDDDYDEEEETVDGNEGEEDIVGQQELPPGWKTIVFEAGPIGLQLEPTVDDQACRVYGFLDAGPDKPSPARASGLIQMGDVIVMVNGIAVQSYDDTIGILKAGGRREITFRPGTPADEYDEDGASAAGADPDGHGRQGEAGAGEDDDASSSQRAAREREKKAKKAAKKAKKEAKKDKKDSKKDKKKKDKKKREH